MNNLPIYAIELAKIRHILNKPKKTIDLPLEIIPEPEKEYLFKEWDDEE